MIISKGIIVVVLLSSCLRITESKERYCLALGPEESHIVASAKMIVTEANASTTDTVRQMMGRIEHFHHHSGPSNQNRACERGGLQTDLMFV